jgi:hypothetical protein
MHCQERARKNTQPRGERVARAVPVEVEMDWCPRHELNVRPAV